MRSVIKIRARAVCRPCKTFHRLGTPVANHPRNLQNAPTTRMRAKFRMTVVHAFVTTQCTEASITHVNSALSLRFERAVIRHEQSRRSGDQKIACSDRPVSKLFISISQRALRSSSPWCIQRRLLRCAVFVGDHLGISQCAVLSSTLVFAHGDGAVRA